MFLYFLWCVFAMLLWCVFMMLWSILFFMMLLWCVFYIFYEVFVCFLWCFMMCLYVFYDVIMMGFYDVLWCVCMFFMMLLWCVFIFDVTHTTPRFLLIKSESTKCCKHGIQKEWWHSKIAVFEIVNWSGHTPNISKTHILWCDIWSIFYFYDVCLCFMMCFDGLWCDIWSVFDVYDIMISYRI